MKKTILALSALALAIAGPAFAHHSANAQYDVSKAVTVTGVLVQFDNINPHSRWMVVVKGPKGETKLDLESISPAVLRRQGVKVKEDIVIGNTYTFTYAPPWNGSNTGLLTEMVIKGKTYIYDKL
jgi:hypothetical protein